MEKKKISKKKIVIAVLVVIFIIIAALIFILQRWLLSEWATMSVSELLYHLKVPLEGTGEEMTWRVVKNCVIPIVVVAAIVIGIYFLAKKRKKRKPVIIVYFIIGVILFVISGISLNNALDVTGYLRSYTSANSKDYSDDFIYNNYIDPKEVKIDFPEKQRNLIFIFLESMERTYTDKAEGGNFDKNFIPELTEIAKDNVCFGAGNINGALSLPGTDWTMGAMFAQSSGLPLQIPIGGNQMNSRDDFFPTITTLGDILENQGYRQQLLIGSKAVFGGRDNYYSEHGDYEICDYIWALDEEKINEDYYVNWGYEDEKLFEFAKDQLEELSGSDEPFNLTMLTVDTHFPDGYICRLCDESFSDLQYANVIRCSSKQLSDFLDWIKEQDFYENTTIILSGDHPTMDATFSGMMDENMERKTYFAIVNGDAELENDNERYYSTFDIFPTTLAAMGAKIEGNKLGLGVNLYSNEETLLEKNGFQVCNDELYKPSSFMNSLSRIEIKESDLEYSVKKSKMKLEESDDGKISARFGKINTNINSIKKAEMEVIDPDTGEILKYDMEIEDINSDPNIFWCVTEVDLPFEKAEELEYKVYFSTEKISHHEVWDKTGSGKMEE